MEDSYLPIGSIVILKDNDQKIMINGYFSRDKDDKLFEYSGSLYPEGIVDTKKGIVFNHKKIKTIVYKGLEDEEFIEFSKKVMSISKNYTKAMFSVTARMLFNFLGGDKSE